VESSTPETFPKDYLPLAGAIWRINSIEPLGFKVEFDPEGKLLPAWYSLVLVE
jgi:hypothetical protein